MTIKERIARQRKRRRAAEGRVARLNARIKTRLVRLAQRPALAAYMVRKFDLRYTSGWRSIAHNAVVGGVPGSWHTKGLPRKAPWLNPAANDFVGTESEMARAEAWAASHVPELDEHLIHDAGSGRHLHLGGWGVAKWRMPERGLLKRWRKKRAKAHAEKVDAAKRIEELKKQKKHPARGIDVSNHQGVVDFTKVKKAGYEFVWVKASEGIGFVDSTFLRNVDAARRAGLKVGAYHFLRPREGRTGAAEARAFHGLCKRAGLGRGDLKPALDVELTELGAPATRVYVRQAVDELAELAHVRPVFYTYPSFLAGIWPDGFDEKALLWIAHYRVSKPSIPHPWKSYAAWQYDDRERVPGVTGNCDVNRAPDLGLLINK